MDIFGGGAFGMASLTGTVNKMDYVPNLLGSLNIFDPVPVTTRTIWVDSQDGNLRLIPNSAIGAPPKELNPDSRTAVPLKTTRLAEGFTLYAEEVQGMRAFGSQSELKSVQTEYLRRMARVRQDMEATHEFHRLGALQGKLLDADGTTVIYDYFDAFGVTEPAAINFALDTNTTDVRGKCAAVARQMARSGRGMILPNTQIHALAGDEFFDKLINHETVRATYLNQAAAAELRERRAFESFTYGGITFHNYRGTDDETTVAVPAGEAVFFPVGAREVFKVAYAPAEFGPFVNTPGQETYALNLLDPSGRQAFTRGELYSYPLYLCQRPDVLRRGTV
jgi:hypothetical protein